MGKIESEYLFFSLSLQKYFFLYKNIYNLEKPNIP